jgi:hypothetical protein
MILFYSDYCKHCTVLLDTIKRHDKNNIVKLVSVDVLRSQKRPIDPKIHSVPALLLTTTNEYMFGKSVFDHLLLPNRGVLFTSQISKVNEVNKPNIDENARQTLGEPSAFTLGSIYSESFSSLEDDGQINDKNYKWDLIENGETPKSNIVVDKPIDSSNQDNSSQKKNLPTMEDILKQRATDLV